MKTKIYLLLFTAVSSFALLQPVYSQNCVPTGLNHSTITSTCDQVCRTLTFQVPDLRSTSSYTIISIPYLPYAYVTPGGTTDNTLYQDDAYSNIFSLPFPFCFYDNVYNQAVISSNGLVTFDIQRKIDCPNPGGAAWEITNPIPFGGFPGCAQNNYPKLSIMGMFMDLDPRPQSSAANKKIEWRVEGSSPCRRFVVSYFNVGLYENFPCGPVNSLTSFQIVMTESTGVIDIFIDRKIPCTGTSAAGRAILGIQGDIIPSPSQWLAAPGKNGNNPAWGAIREGYRFVPTGGTSRFIQAELLQLDHTPIATASVANTIPGLLDLNFANICTPATTGDYVLKTSFSSCSDPTVLLEAYDTITVERNPDLGATASSTNTLCGAPSGSITITTPPGVGTNPFTVVLNPGPGQITQTGTSPVTISNLPQGTYTAVVTDASGNCSSVIPDIVVDRTNNLAANINTVATSCATATNGQIVVTPTTGSAPYTFSLDGNTAVTGPIPYTFSNLPSGPHNIVVTDASGCVTAQLPADITAGSAFVTTVNSTAVLCNGGTTGTITVTVPATGTPPFEYSLDGVLWQTSNTFTGLAANTYTVYYREGSGCQGSQPISVAEPLALSISNNTTAVVCNGQSNGIITVTPGGGVGPYQYSNDGGVTWQASNIFTVPANIYNIIVRDANNCTTAPQTATVTEPFVLTASAATTNATCNGGNNGTITVTANGGNAGYQYSLDGVNFQSSNVFNVAASPTAYTVTIRDSKGCITTTTATVGQTNDLTFTPQTDATICEGTSTQLQFVSNAIQYSWTPATGLSNPSIADPVANPAVTTTYTVTATLGLCSTTDDVIVNVNTAPVPNAGPDGFICYGQTYTLQGSGGTQYTWTPSTYLSSTSIANPVSSPSKTITYTLSEVTDAIGCRSLVTDDVTVDVTPPIKVTTFPFDTVAYAGDQFQLNATSIATNYTWSPATGLSNPNIANPIVTAGPIGSVIMYQVTASTAAGCQGNGYVSIKVYTGPDIYVPTAFTPNNDGKNDKFIPFPVGIKSIKHFYVFNRWGQLVFSTAKLNDGWDGKMGGLEQPTGVYVWMVEGITKANKVITKKGTVMLTR